MDSKRRAFFTGFVRDELRPPGARSEEEFVARCIKCQRCVASCPYSSIVSANWSWGLAVGTPIIKPREIPCYLCMICPDVCPTGALEPLELEQVDMGEAVINEETCYAFQGILCRACVDACPLQDKAIAQDLVMMPVVYPEHCVGCGLCVKACPAEPEAIRVLR